MTSDGGDNQVVLDRRYDPTAITAILPTASWVKLPAMGASGRGVEESGVDVAGDGVGIMNRQLYVISTMDGT